MLMKLPRNAMLRIFHDFCVDIVITNRFGLIGIGRMSFLPKKLNTLCFAQLLEFLSNVTNRTKYRQVRKS